ncbi:MAG: hypothetical protein R6U96_05815 [Promethearchaeia archaeon]
MSINVKMFGDLKEKVTHPDPGAGIPIKLKIDKKNVFTVGDVFQQVNIKKEDVSHIFVNGTYSGFKKNVKNGDLVSIFPKNMGLLYKWYFKKEEDDG